MSAASDLTLFFGRLHPLLVHLPIGLLILLATLEFLALWPRFKYATAASGLILALAAPAIVVTIGCGWLLAQAGGYDQRLIDLHKYFGFATGAACLLAGLLYALNRRKLYRACLGVSLVALTVASHFGGSLTHGSDYLTRYAPQPLKTLLMAKTPAPTQKAVASTNAPVPVFSAVVQPVLNEYCVSCHGPEKAKGKLRLDTHDALMKGGENGLVVQVGKSQDSELVKRVELPLTSDEHMPPDGKPQPKSDDLLLLKWWIDQGAPRDKGLAELKASGKVAQILAARLGSSNSSMVAGPALAQSGPAAIPREQAVSLGEKLSGELGVPITAIAQTDGWLQCSASIAGADFGDAQLRSLSALGPNIRWLDLGGTAVSDAGLAHLAKMPNVTRLHLERTPITDAGLTNLAGLNQLEYLNLYATTVTDEGLAHLKELPALRQVYLWQTKVTATAAKALAEARFDKDQVAAWEQQIEQLKAKIKNAQTFVDIGLALANKPVNTAPINTKCPVSGKPVNLAKTLLHEGKRIGFCCDDCLAEFQKDPKPFLAKLESQPKPAMFNEKCPVSGKPVDPQKTVVHEGRLVAFCCDDCRAQFQKDPKSYLSKLAPSAEGR